MLVVPSSNTEAKAVKNKFPPRERASCAEPLTVSAMPTAATNATPASAASRFEAPNIASDNHSQANHGCPGRVYENGSFRGSADVLKILSPLRMCQPVSLSWNNLELPRERNRTSKIATAKIKTRKFGKTQEASGVTCVSSLDR